MDSKYTEAYQRLIGILDKHQIAQKLIKATKDIWCRDYMPIQISRDEFVQFRYEPSYLEGYEETQSDPKTVCNENGIQPKYSNINLDGGNVIRWERIQIGSKW